MHDTAAVATRCHLVHENLHVMCQTASTQRIATPLDEELAVQFAQTTCAEKLENLMKLFEDAHRSVPPPSHSL